MLTKHLRELERQAEVIKQYTKNKKVMQYTKRELESLETIEQAWDGDELKIDNKDGIRVWLTHRENRQYGGDYTIEKLVDGVWIQKTCYF